MERKNSIYRVLYYECPIVWELFPVRWDICPGRWDFSRRFICLIWYVRAVSLLRCCSFLFASFRLFWVYGIRLIPLFLS